MNDVDHRDGVDLEDAALLVLVFLGLVATGYLFGGVTASVGTLSLVGYLASGGP